MEGLEDEQKSGLRLAEWIPNKCECDWIGTGRRVGIAPNWWTRPTMRSSFSSRASRSGNYPDVRPLGHLLGALLHNPAHSLTQRFTTAPLRTPLTCEAFDA